ncbi:MAG: UDP-N-acetylmuramate--L-alanine ligase [Clostridia bacterium]|nr:UDP-N-acetylmuramate--L-alanine ligase [Clostridia bacterium]
MANLEELEKYRKIHMIGIGGVSMSGIAEILKNWGFTVTGSDTAQSEYTDALISNGIQVKIGHDLDAVLNADLVVYTAAISQEDPELVRARNMGIPTIERGDFLGILTKVFNDTICVSGTHGKTTTTSMIASCFLEGKLDPTIQVGAYFNQINANYRVGNSEYFIIEACEYVESFLKFYPKTEVILNIDNDHLDYFKDIEHIILSFKKYVKLLPANGLLVINSDDPNCSTLAKCTEARTITFGINNLNANFVARNITYNKNGFPTFDVYYNNAFYKTISLNVTGIHNVMNALACIGVCHSYGLNKEQIKNGLAKFTGAHRRFEYVGEFGNHVCVYDDYAHHPTEIKATAMAMKNKPFNKSWVIFQPHTYSRTKNLLQDFARVLTLFDNIIITDIYAAREKNTYDISSQDLVNEIQKLGKKAIYMSDFNEIASFVKANALNNDLVLTLGAGTVTEIKDLLVEPKND